MDIGTKIKEIRKAKGLTQKALAKKANLSVASIQGYEQKKYKPKKETIEQIANALDIPSYELFLCESKDDKFNEIGEIIVKALQTSNINIPINIDQETKEIFVGFPSEKSMEDFKNLNKKTTINRMLSYMEKLNEIGKEKATEQVELLTKIPEYKNDPDQDQEN